ncbi:RagB/SusD family nutrient uptake outer membrane protein [Salegentibacter sp.]|uniref:RagB/SusD family nutrient uptake outer membrane protein n=1 Tax=Salegentibacter sp. TaxID=1903072 RepID=UPI003568781A
MKIYKIFLLLALAVITGCSDDFLDRQPLDSINTENYPATADELVTIVNGAYQPMQRPKLYNMRMWTTDIIAGNSIVGAGGGTDGIETTNMANFVTSTDNAGALDLWRGPWPGILMSNIVLDVAPTIEIDEDIRDRSMGEAYFLRAHYYNILATFFGDVPLVTVPQSSDDDLLPERDPVEEVYAQVINDLIAAAELLPQKSAYNGENLGRVPKAAAYGLLAKVHLSLGNWQEAADAATEVENLGYALNDNYADNFSIDNENGVESIFEVQYTDDAGEDFWSDDNQSSWTSPFMGPRGANFVAGGYGWNQPTEEFVNSYEEGDQRKDATILYEGGPDFDGKEYDSDYSQTGYNVRKFLVPLSEVSAYDNSPLNFPVLRYADILLVKAEALNELGRTDEAEDYLNMVRNRAGLDDIVQGLGQEEFKEAVLHERRIELAFEGQRWLDLIRVNNGQYGLDFLHSIGKNNASEKHLLFPIPQIELDRNPNLSQNPGY